MGDRSLNKGKFLGIVGGLGVFILFLLFLIYPNLDFDQQLINDVDGGVPASQLIPKIEAESQEEQLIAKKDFESHINNPYYWSKPGLASTDDFNYDKRNYEISMNAIKKLEELRKEYALKKIGKEEFVTTSSYYKDYIENFHWFF